MAVRLARVADAPAVARVHVQSWRETYRGLMSDEVLDDPGFVPARERFWQAALTDPRWARNSAAVAEDDGQVIGIAMSGPPQDAGARWPAQLFLMYVLATHHGSGAASALLDAVIAPSEAAALWVADPNPRAQAFYRKRGFEPDGTSKIDDGVRAVRMVRTALHEGAHQVSRCGREPPHPATHRG